jgi:hypothetical protein
MADESTEFDEAMRKWRGLAPPDRQAVLQRLSPERRDIFQRLIAAADEEAGLIAARPPRFHGLSTWLAQLVEASESGTAEAKELKPAVRSALIRGHEQASGGAVETVAPFALPRFLQTLLQRLKELL